MQDSDFDALPDKTPSGTIEVTLPDVHVFSDKPLVLVMKIAHRAWNEAFANAITKRQGDIEAARALTDRVARSAPMNEVYAETVVVGWQNCNGPDGQPLPYTPANAVIVFRAAIIRKGLWDQLDAAFVEAMDVSRFRRSPAAVADSLGK